MHKKSASVRGSSVRFNVSEGRGPGGTLLYQSLNLATSWYRKSVIWLGAREGCAHDLGPCAETTLGKNWLQRGQDGKSRGVEVTEQKAQKRRGWMTLQPENSRNSDTVHTWGIFPDGTEGLGRPCRPRGRDRALQGRARRWRRTASGGAKPVPSPLPSRSGNRGAAPATVRPLGARRFA